MFIAVAVKYRAALNALPSRNQSFVQAKGDLLLLLICRPRFVRLNQLFDGVVDGFEKFQEMIFFHAKNYAFGPKRGQKWEVGR